MQNDLEEGVVMALEDHSQSDTPEVSREEVVRAVNKLQHGKAAGGDKVVAELVKKGGETMVNWLLELIQEVCRSGKIPHFYPFPRRRTERSVYKLQRNITAQRTWKGTRSSFAGEVASSD